MKQMRPDCRFKRRRLNENEAPAPVSFACVRMLRQELFVGLFELLIRATFSFQQELPGRPCLPLLPLVANVLDAIFGQLLVPEEAGNGRLLRVAGALAPGIAGEDFGPDIAFQVSQGGSGFRTQVAEFLRHIFGRGRRAVNLS